MKFLCLVHAPAAAWEDAGEEERQEVHARYRAFIEEAEAAGKLDDAAQLRPATTATTVRVRSGETQVTDGPFAETTEQLGGYVVLECEDVEEALALAARIPGAARGAVEVRPQYVEEAAA